MKCRYNFCKHGGEVTKEESVKEGGSYFHRECLKEKQLKSEIEKFYCENMPPTTMPLLRKAINQLLIDKGFEAEYVLYVLKWIVSNKKPVKSPFSIVYYCINWELTEQWKKIKINKEYQRIKSEIESSKPTQSNSFSYSNNSKKKTDLI